MSTFHQEKVICPHCGNSTRRMVAHSVNGGRAPHHRTAILDGTFQVVACEECQHPFEIGHPFLYVDVDRKQWIQVHTVEQAPQWRKLAEQAAALFEAMISPPAPPVVKRVMAGTRVRLVFGTDALREKLLCDDAGLDDGTLEVLKLQLLHALRGQPAQPAKKESPAAPAGTSTLRLVAIQEDALIFAALEDAAVTAPPLFAASRALYEDLSSEPLVLQAFKDCVTYGPYVDGEGVRGEAHGPRAARAVSS